MKFLSHVASEVGKHLFQKGIETAITHAPKAVSHVARHASHQIVKATSPHAASKASSVAGHAWRHGTSIASHTQKFLQDRVRRGYIFKK